jgi:prepilin-type processing-associated H-X9-DG protein
MVGKDTSTYLCPAFKKAAVIKYQESGTSELQDLWRSYVMNYRFHWHGGGGSAFFWHGDFTASWGGIQRSPETVLMFAEIQQPEGDQPFDTSEEGLDGKLDPEHDKEHIGFNHRVGKKNIAHVVFADGHVAVLLEPPGADGSSDTKLEELSLQLCNGEAIDKDLLN